MQEIIKPLVSLGNFTTWRVGGPAEWLAEPQTIDEVKELITWSKNNNLRCQAIGAGSNLLINDQILKGITLCMKKLQGCKINNVSGSVIALGGESIPVLARRAAKAGLHGLEWSVGIPGTVGGAVVMNAGAQGNCTADRLHSVKVISIKEGKEFELTKKDLGFSYRNSVLQNEELIVLSARFELEPGHDQNELTRLTNSNLNHRLKTQPYNQPSCGSVFRNPEPLKAGQIIEGLGLKGFRIGGAEISKIHANFIVNTHHATAKDISKLISIVQKKVLDVHGFILQPEVKKIGF
nr:UDP-N-acetylmuramate dehydrogenase [Prochlorococcus marinus]